ncbi:MAG: hypothetical protein HYS24_09860 [Ignavibacteriales bacterium]|nr:hypothetical protein [Ignavibacteriales bacterium]
MKIFDYIEIYYNRQRIHSSRVCKVFCVNGK